MTADPEALEAYQGGARMPAAGTVADRLAGGAPGQDDALILAVTVCMDSMASS